MLFVFVLFVVVLFAGVVVVVALAGCCSAFLTCAGVMISEFCDVWIATDCDVLKVVFEDRETRPALLLENLPVDELETEPALAPLPEEPPPPS